MSGSLYQPIGPHIDILSGFAFASELFSNEPGNGMPLIRIRDLLVHQSETYFTGAYEPTYVMHNGDILVGMDGDFNAVRWQGGDALLNQRICRVSSASPQLNEGYLYHWLQPKLVEIHQQTPQTTVRHLSVKDIVKIEIPFFPPREQRCIAKILDAADEAIRQTERVIAKLKAVKAGLLHDLLTRGLDEHGHLRDAEAHPEQFKASPLGRIPGGWNVSSVDSEFELATGFTLGQHRRPRQNKRRYLRVANVLRERILLDDVAELEARDEEMIGRVLQEDDLLIVEGHANPDEIGRCARVPPEAAGLTFQNHLFRLRSKRLNPRFALAWFNGEWVRAHWRCLCGTSSGLNTINSTMLKAVPIPVPEEQEQRDIAMILDNHDTRIRAEEAELTKLRQVKRGLMDDLLTGRVRVA